MEGAGQYEGCQCARLVDVRRRPISIVSRCSLLIEMGVSVVYFANVSTNVQKPSERV